MKYEVFPRRWGKGHIVTTPVKGNVESVEIKSGGKIQEKQVLVMIRPDQGKVKQILSGSGGTVEMLKVKAGDKVVHGDVLFFIKEDL
ncbi:Biotin-requiring enzyme [Lentibacillus persicus]|uniref:Biotin-requiring enzyme n=1 Tax=Lentibacillus persicus TaxID=640948 RepID=A0A1I1YF20_9BACI|nr:biotin/lipoyl-containing protein [Lentibacillus persicus]SFE18177.1 Biotin-requiring enzyme [Lentibacillus persicus]